MVRAFSRKLSASIIAGLVSIHPVLACGFHNYAPQPTMVDRLFGSDQIVLARPDPDNPFRYIPVEVIEGVPADIDLPHLVDSTTRRRLALQPNSAVLFARDEADGSWHRLAHLDSTTEPVLRTVFARLAAWEMGPDTDRFRYFASLLNHPDRGVHALALRELDLADYRELRELPLDVDAARLRVQLGDPTEVDLRPIRILLLGLSDADDLQPDFRTGLRRSIELESSELGAYATALIELGGAPVVEEIAAAFLVDRELPLLVREVLIEAMALHNQSGTPELKETISASLGAAVWVDPRLAGAIARQFGSRNDGSQYAVLTAALQEKTLTAPEDIQDVLQYLSIHRVAQP